MKQRAKGNRGEDLRWTRPPVYRNKPRSSARSRRKKRCWRSSGNTEEDAMQLTPRSITAFFLDIHGPNANANQSQSQLQFQLRSQSQFPSQFRWKLMSLTMPLPPLFWPMPPRAMPGRCSQQSFLRNVTRTRGIQPGKGGNTGNLGRWGN
jgi:hypothetical protein